MMRLLAQKKCGKREPFEQLCFLMKIDGPDQAKGSNDCRPSAARAKLRSVEGAKSALASPIFFLRLCRPKITPVYAAYWRFAKARQDVYFSGLTGSVVEHEDAVNRIISSEQKIELARDAMRGAMDVRFQLGLGLEEPMCAFTTCERLGV
jgi:hypothetical protein